MFFKYLFGIWVGVYFLIGSDSFAQPFWKKLGTPTHSLARHSDLLYLSGDSSILVSTFNMGLFKSPDDGLTWKHILPLPKDQPIFTLYATSTGNILAAGYNKVYISHDQGEKWKEVALDYADVSKIAEDEKGNLYISSTHPVGVLTSKDGGYSWEPYNTGLQTMYVDDLISDRVGNLFCSVVDTNSVGKGGLYYLNPQTNQWIKKEVKVNMGGKVYSIRIDGINAMAIANSKHLYLSFVGTIVNMTVSGIFKNSLQGAITESLWEQEVTDDKTNIPISAVVEELYFTHTGNLFASRNSGVSVGIHSKMSYTKKWNECIEGISPAILVLSRFAEKKNGTLLLAVQYLNQLYMTQESKAGKKVQHIAFEPLPAMKLYEQAPLQAHSSTGGLIEFKSMNSSQAYIEEKQIKAVGLGRVDIKAYLEGNDSLYYAEQIQPLFIHKAANLISVDSLPAKLEKGDSTLLYASAYSGLAVRLKVVAGEATLQKDTLAPPQSGYLLFAREAGRVHLIGTEEGNETYAAADTLRMSFCVYPTKPVLHMVKDSLTNKIQLISSNGQAYQWYHNGRQLTSQDQSLIVEEPGEYRVRTYSDDCVSEISEPIQISITGLEDSYFEASIKIYPVPFTEVLTIEKTSYFRKKPFQYTLVDVLGKAIMVTAVEDETKIELHTENMHPGVYLLKIESEYTRGIWKVIKK
jgi:hypothetical protein